MNFSEDHVIAVNERDEWLGTVEKMRAHQEGLLHRAFSIFILNSRNEMLIQQRADGKYHSPGLWSNACCSHPRPGEAILAGAHRRLREELGFGCTLYPLFEFRYRSDVGAGMVENEYDHIYIGHYDQPILFERHEVKDYRYIAIDALEQWMSGEPAAFSQWFLLAMPLFRKHHRRFSDSRITSSPAA
jgi:isopentenyl-diphosphate delta-isomerase